jgi:hypothetical protein
MDFDDINVVGVLFAVIGFGIGIIVSKSMESGLVMRIAAGFVCAIACYFIGGKLADG